MGRPFDEATLYKAAYAYEQGAKPRRLPPSVPPLPK
jgi:Asp-tRNA(Asn)/Glu-tRNA(Gln) amidotransferase A subunit family amidase